MKKTLNKWHHLFYKLKINIFKKRKNTIAILKYKKWIMSKSENLEESKKL